MGLTKLVLKRPVTTLLGVLCLIFFGAMSLLNSKLELTPDINLPMYLISTVYPGASPEDIDELITRPIEGELAVLSGVKSISSYDAENASMIAVQYDYGTDMDKAYADLKKKLDGVAPRLPEDAQDAAVMEFNINEQPSLSLSVNNPTKDNLYNYVNNDLVPHLEKLSAVASVQVGGGRREYIQVKLNPGKLAQYHLDMSTIAQQVAGARFTYPAGQTGYGSQQLSVSSGRSVDSVEALKSIPLLTAGGSTLYLSDVADIVMAEDEQSALSRYNGQETMTLQITKTQKYSAVDLSRQVLSALKSLQRDDPNLSYFVIQDQAKMITNSLSSVFQTMLLAVLISMAIIFLFFGDWKASMIVGTSIPISILTALVMMWALGYSLNLITLSAMVLGVGMMVDNSIVVLEACFREMDRQADKAHASFLKAALGSVHTVGASIFGSTLTTCVVFLPIGFLAGLSGQFFSPLAFTIVFCMVASLISAATIVPLCFVFYKPKENQRACAYRGIHALQDAYRRLMRRVLPHKKTVMLGTVALLLLSFVLAGHIRTELMPAADEGTIAISVNMKPGLKLEAQNELLKKLEAIVTNDPDTESYMLTSGGSAVERLSGGGGTQLTAYLKDGRSKTTRETVRQWRRALEQLPDMVVQVSASSVMSGMSPDSADYEYIIEGVDYDALKRQSDSLVELLRGEPALTAVHSSLENAAPLIKVRVDELAAAAEGLSPIQVAGQVNLLLSGKEAMKLNLQGQELAVRLMYPEDSFDTLEKLRTMSVYSPAGKAVMLQDIAGLGFEDAPAMITRVDRRYQAIISAHYTEQADSRTAARIDRLIDGKLSAGIERASNLNTQMQNEEFSALSMAIGIAVFLVFVVMAAQFESPRFSLMVMTTIPFSLIGSFFLLWLCDASLSMPSLLGFLMLIGTVVNNGILYVDTVNQFREEMDLKTALVEAGAVRMRPILMTTLTTVLSMVPMAMAMGDSGEIMQGLALVDVGGLTASTILALLMLPVYYAVMQGRRAQKRKHLDLSKETAAGSPEA